MELLGFALIPIITGLTEALKRATGVNDRYIPLLAVVIGSALVVGFNGFTAEVLLTGLVAGLASVGLWEIGKHTVVGK